MKLSKRNIVLASTLGYALFAITHSLHAQPSDGNPNTPTVAPERVAPQENQEGLEAMLTKAGGGSVRVILTLSPSLLGTREGSTNTDAFNLPAEAFVEPQNKLIRNMRALGITELKVIEGTPLVVGVVNAQQLRELSRSGQVSRIEEDKVSLPTLQQSVPLINAPAFWGSVGAGTKGQGQVVAVLDSGVMASHNFLAGKVVSEACFSTTGTYNSGTIVANAVCTTGSTAPGSAAPCAVPGAACWHGTHVAGIAVGKANGSTLYNGVAPEAKLLPIQVFSKITTSGGTGIGAFDSDVLAGLAHVKARKIAGVNIASVNLSLGGGNYASHCSGTTASPSSFQTIMSQLSALKVATIVASGNDSYANAVGSPACTTAAITVGASTKSDTLAPYSNSSSMIDVLAPGSAILSATSSNTSSYASANGTSMAAPHVAGAYALLRQRYPCYPQSVIDNAVRTTGVAITHPTNGQTYNRINLQAANVQLYPLRFVHACKIIDVMKDVNMPRD